MTLDKVIGILLLTLSIALGVFYFSDKATENVSDKEAGRVFLTGMMGKINQISEIVITENTSKTHLNLKGGHWVVDEKSGYVADFSKVKTLLLGLAELKTIEPKTAKPENYGKLGVQGAHILGSSVSKQIDLLDKAGNLQYSLIVGKEKPARSPSGLAAIYVRKPTEAKAWLVSGKLQLPRKQTEWLDHKIIDIPPQEIMSVEVNQPGQDLLRVSKNKASDKNFVVEGLPLNAVMKSESEANSLSGALQNLMFIDVLPRGKFQANVKDITTVTFQTFDGWRLAAKLLEKDGKSFVWFDVIRDAKSENPSIQRAALTALFPLWVYEIHVSNVNVFVKTLSDLIQINQAEK